MPIPEPQSKPAATPAEKLLLESWNCYGEYDAKANRLQKRFRRLQMAILLLGILVVVSVVAQQRVKEQLSGLKSPASDVPQTEQQAYQSKKEKLNKTSDALHWAVLALPLLLSSLIAASHTFRPGDKWVILRGAAEAVKRQIFRFRTRTGDYFGGPDQPKPEQVLFERVSAINDQLKQTEVSKCALEAPSRGPGESDLNKLSPDQYFELRVNDQLAFYTKRTRRFDRSISRSTIMVLFFGAAGTYVAAVGQELWVPVATGIAAAFTSYLRYTQSEETLITYNRARTDLLNIRAWWSTLTPNEQLEAANYGKLVDLTETVLEEETAGWSQRMNDALAELAQKPPGRDTRPRDDAK